MTYISSSFPSFYPFYFFQLGVSVFSFSLFFAPPTTYSNTIYLIFYLFSFFSYNFEQDTGCGAISCVGNKFMNLMQGYAAIKPVMPAAGNHGELLLK
jgi:hypothetical protein